MEISFCGSFYCKTIAYFVLIVLFVISINWSFADNRKLIKNEEQYISNSIVKYNVVYWLSTVMHRHIDPQITR